MPSNPASTQSVLTALLAQLQSRYPMASLISEFLTVHEGNYVVRALVEVGGTTLATGMAAAEDVESAEDRAKIRALEALRMQPVEVPPSSQPHFFTAEIQLPSVADQTVADQSDMLQNAVPQLTDDEYSSSGEEDESYGSYEDAGDDEATFLSADVDLEEVPTNGKSLGQSGSDPDSTSTHPANLEMAVTTDLSDAIAQTDVEMRRLGWNKKRGREYLQQTYGKQTRQELNDSELINFLHYLQSQPSGNSPF